MECALADLESPAVAVVAEATDALAAGLLGGAVDAAVFERPKRLVGPWLTAAGAYLAWVVSIEPARELDARTRDVVERRLFADWLREQREQATIEWNWSHDD